MSSVKIPGKPTPRQQEFFDARERYVAYGGARGGGKSWALRRKLVAMCLRFPSLRCLLVRRTYPELKANHVSPFLQEYGALVSWSEADKELTFENGSQITFGYCASDSDGLRYQGQEYDIIAIDEATQLSEACFGIFKACLRGTQPFPRRMYLTCNPGGIGHAWVKRLFVDRQFRKNEDPKDYRFIPAKVFDNEVLLAADPDYVRSLKSLPLRLREAWLFGKWDVFEGQFFPEFDTEVHVCTPAQIPKRLKHFLSFDYGFDMLAALVMGMDEEGNLYVLEERCSPDLTLSAAARQISELGLRYHPEFAVASPDLWNRRQDSGKSGFEIMQAVPGMPPMIPADNRRIPGWRMLREYLSGSPGLRISACCVELCRCLPALLCHKERPEDASNEPHHVTHAPEALRYAVMSRCPPPTPSMHGSFRFSSRSSWD